VLTHIKPFLETHDILLLYGARQVGKTSLMKMIQQDLKGNTLFITLEDEEYLTLLNQNPKNFVRYLQSVHNRQSTEKITIFIDEVQYLDNPTNFLKYLYDEQENIKCIVS
jgi:predicted AAA+ superfamily ATPase